MANAVNFYRKTTAPGAGQWAQDAIYFVQKSADEAELYLTDSSGNPFKVSNTDFTEAIISALKGATNGIASLDGSGKIPASQLPAISTASELVIENTFANFTSNQSSYGANRMVLVKDASGDANVNSGAALYVWDETAGTGTRIAEFESLDVNLSFNIKKTGGTASTFNAGDTLEFEQGTGISITKTGNKFTIAVSGGSVHSHTNLALLETYTQTEADLADAVSKEAHSREQSSSRFLHANKRGNFERGRGSTLAREQNAS